MRKEALEDDKRIHLLASEVQQMTDLKAKLEKENSLVKETAL